MSFLEKLTNFYCRICESFYILDYITRVGWSDDMIAMKNVKKGSAKSTWKLFNVRTKKA